MSTSVAVDLNHPLLHTPYSIDEPLQIPPEYFRTPYSQRLAFWGLVDKAIRADNETSYFRHFRDSTRDTWRECAANAMLRTMPHHAKELAEQQYNKYLPLREFISLKGFSSFVFRVTACNPADHQEILGAIRTLVTGWLPKSIDKIGTYDEDRTTLKVLHVSKVDYNFIRDLQVYLPDGVQLRYQNHGIEDFSSELHALFAPDLPSSASQRADFEATLEGIHQVKLHKFTKEEREKFVYTSPEYTNCSDEENEPDSSQSDNSDAEKPQKPKRVPKNPRTGLPAIWMSKIVSDSVKSSDILEQDWIPIVA
jgi:hypothetical protein